MRCTYIHHNILKEDKFYQRVFGMLPGLLSWGIIVAMLILTIRKPFFAVGIAIAFALYWILKMLYCAFFLQQTYKRVRVDGNQGLIL